MPIATVITIIGQAWARDTDGNLRELSVGDVLVEGETLITADNARVELDFGDGIDPTVIEGAQQIVMTLDLSAGQEVAAEDFSGQDEDLEALLAALDDDDVDLLDIFDATAAGAGPGGGGGGGSTFVRLGRISLDTDPLGYGFAGPSTDDTELPETVALAGGGNEELSAENQPISGDDGEGDDDTGNDNDNPLDSLPSPIEEVLASNGNARNGFEGSGNPNQFNAAVNVTASGYGVLPSQNSSGSHVSNPNANDNDNGGGNNDSGANNNQELLFKLGFSVDEVVFSINGDPGAGAVGEYFLYRDDEDGGVEVVGSGFISSGNNQVESEEQFDYLLISGVAGDGDTGFFVEITQVGDVLIAPAAGGELEGTSGDDILYGQGGKDTLIGGEGDDIIYGGDVDDILEGGAGDDVLVGGAGSDTLTGGSGNDVFKWNFGDQGTSDTSDAGSAAIDVVTDFGDDADDDVLDISDLLQDEDADNIDSYVLAKEGEGAEEGNLLLYIKHDGGEEAIDGDGSNADQVIKLEGKSFNSWEDDEGNAFDNGDDLIQHLIETGQINIDQ